MSTTSVNLLRERVLRAAKACARELEEREAMVHTKATRELLRSVKALEQETWRIDEAPALVKELLQLVKLNPEPTSMLGEKIRHGRHETVLRAESFLGERSVDDDTTPAARSRKGILRQAQR